MGGQACSLVCWQEARVAARVAPFFVLSLQPAPPSPLRPSYNQSRTSRTLSVPFLDIALYPPAMHFGTTDRIAIPCHRCHAGKCPDVVEWYFTVAVTKTSGYRAGNGVRVVRSWSASPGGNNTLWYETRSRAVACFLKMLLARKESGSSKKVGTGTFTRESYPYRIRHPRAGVRPVDPFRMA